MSDDWSQYRAQPKTDEWAQYHSSNFQKRPKGDDEKSPEKNNEGYFRRNFINPLKATKGKNSLETAGNLADLLVNKPIEMTGLPSIGRGFFQGGENIVRGIGNIPADIQEWRGHPINPVKIPGLGQVYPIPETNFDKLAPLKNTNPYVNEAGQDIGQMLSLAPISKIYQGLKGGVEALPYSRKIPEMVKNLLAGTATGAAVSPDNRGLGAALGSASELVPASMRGAKNYFQGRNTPGREKDLYKAMMEHEMQKADLESLKNLSTHKFGKNNPEALMLSAQDKAAQLEEAEAFKRRHFPNEQMLPGQQLVPEAEHWVKNTNEVLKQTLGEGDTHSQDLSKHIVEAFEGVPTIEAHPKTGLPREVRVGGERKAWGAKMDELEHNLPEVEIPSTDTHSVDAALKSYYGKKSDISEEEKEAFKKLIEPAYTKNKKISGRQFFRAYRSLRTIEGKERSKAFGLSPKEHDEWIDRANETKKTYEDMEKIIAKHFPEGTMKQLYELNHEYSNKIAPLHENPMYQQMLKHGRYEGDMVEALSGTTSGNKILNNMIQNDPELSRLVLGHSFAENPAKLMKPNKAIEPFVRANPQIAELMGHQKTAASALEAAKRNEEMFKHVEKIPKLSQEIHEQRMFAKRLEQEAEVTGLTKAEVDKKIIEYEKAQKKLRALTNKLIGASILGTGVGYVAKKVRE